MLFIKLTDVDLNEDLWIDMVSYSQKAEEDEMPF